MEASWSQEHPLPANLWDFRQKKDVFGKSLSQPNEFEHKWYDVVVQIIVLR